MKQLSTLLIVVILFTAITPALKAQVNTQDSLALVDLYDSTGGANWTNHTNWLTKAPVSSWFGITIDSASGRVIGINLSTQPWIFMPIFSSNLQGVKPKGTIPSSIGNLTELRILILTNIDYDLILTGFSPPEFILIYDSITGLTGNIPSSIGNLTKLTQLDLSYNHLTGSIPTSLTNLLNLTNFSLEKNNLTGSIPDSIGKLANIDTLFINSNQLTGSIPTSINNLTTLGDFDLSNNNLSGTIPSMANLSHAISGHNFNLSNNDFTFSGMESFVSFIDTIYRAFIPEETYYFSYAPQNTIPINKIGNTLSVSVGGTLANDTFKWYKDSVLVATIAGDSSYVVTSIGNYHVVAINSIASYPTPFFWYGLKLYSDTINVATVPIKSINLQAKATNGQVLLQWQTIDEINTASFTIQHSTDGAKFSDIATKEAVGEGNNAYSMIDSPPAPQKGVLYYRIKAIDKVGFVSYSNVASIQLTIDNYQLIVYPNPAKGSVTISGNHIASVRVIDNIGRMAKIISLNDATNPTLPISGLAAGVYNLRIQTTDGKVGVVSFVKE